MCVCVGGGGVGCVCWCASKDELVVAVVLSWPFSSSFFLYSVLSSGIC